MKQKKNIWRIVRASVYDTTQVEMEGEIQQIIKLAAGMENRFIEWVADSVL